MACNTCNLPSTTLPCCIAKVRLVLGAGLLSKQQAALQETKEIRLSSKGRLKNWWKRHWPIHQPNLIPENQAEESGLACSTHSVFLCGTENQKTQCQLSARPAEGGPSQGSRFPFWRGSCDDTVMPVSQSTGESQRLQAGTWRALSVALDVHLPESTGDCEA